MRIIIQQLSLSKVRMKTNRFFLSFVYSSFHGEDIYNFHEFKIISFTYFYYIDNEYTVNKIFQNIFFYIVHVYINTLTTYSGYFNALQRRKQKKHSH